jgi:pyrroline-5-carboxylate reductase
MQVGLIGAGNMARALARGWGDPVLCTDAGSGRAKALAEELGGEAVASNRELAERTDLVILAHKPAQLHAVAAEAADAAKAVVSLLAGTSQADVRAAYPGVPVFRIDPNTPVEVGRGVLAFALPDGDHDPELRERVRALFARVGTVVDVPEPLVSIAGACSGVGPAYWALLVEAQVDAAVKHGIPATVATTLVTETMAGSAELLNARGGDTLRLRREVASPGGTTARGLAALERAGVRAAFAAAMDDVVRAEMG